MRSQIGPRGAALLLAAAVLGVLLAAHGWSDRRVGLASGTLAVPGSAAPSGEASRPASPSGPTATPGTAKPSPGSRPGPALSTQSFAPYSYLVWPGTPGTAARTAMTGLSITVHQASSGISVSAGIQGQPAPAPRVYPQGARVYVVEAALGDDSGGTDYNLGDDALVVTDARGRIIQ